MPEFRGWKRLKRVLPVLNRQAGWWVDPPELRDGIPIGSLVAPLRYDVMLRLEFFKWYQEHRDDYSDLTDLVAAAQQTSYYSWFVFSDCVRRARGRLLQDESLLRKAFAERVQRSAALFDSVFSSGYRKNTSIILKTGEHLHRPSTYRGCPSGKLVSGRYFLADGCHRLALLMRLGLTVLPHGYYRVRCFREFSPFDSTALLVRSGTVPTARYFKFLSRRYTVPHIFPDVSSFVDFIRNCRPHLLDEVRSILQVDGYWDDGTTL
ncbi:MAG: hypothetical protein EHM23_04440 [Acidobacteria bacterium]|nr:MAG: hypothetical protein EHM23_04440 [Acidobacteriota bacterium]